MEALLLSRPGSLTRLTLREVSDPFVVSLSFSTATGICRFELLHIMTIRVGSGPLVEVPVYCNLNGIEPPTDWWKRL